MNIFFYGLNFLSILLFSIICIVFQSTLFHEWFGIYKPNLIYIVLSYLALNRFSIEGGILSYFIGFLIEVNSGAPAGLYPLVTVLIFFAAKILSESLFINRRISQMLLVVAVSILGKGFLLLVLSMYEPFYEIWRGILVSIIPMVIFNFLLTPLLFFLMQPIDIVFRKTRPSKTGSKESELELMS